MSGDGYVGAPLGGQLGVVVQAHALEQGGGVGAVQHGYVHPQFGDDEAHGAADVGGPGVGDVHPVLGQAVVVHGRVALRHLLRGGGGCGCRFQGGRGGRGILRRGADRQLGRLGGSAAAQPEEGQAAAQHQAGQTEQHRCRQGDFLVHGRDHLGGAGEHKYILGAAEAADHVPPAQAAGDNLQQLVHGLVEDVEGGTPPPGWETVSRAMWMQEPLRAARRASSR